MTPQQRDALNRFLATEVLKVHTCQYGYIADVPDFSKWADCEPLLDKIGKDGWEWQLCSCKPSERNPRWQYYFQIIQDDGDFCDTKGSRTEALCLAIARAYGWKEDEHGIG